MPHNEVFSFVQFAVNRLSNPLLTNDLSIGIHVEVD
jgi:hypothetical protein